MGAWQQVTRVEDLCHVQVSHKWLYHLDACAGSVLTPHDYNANVQKKLGNRVWVGWLVPMLRFLPGTRRNLQQRRSHAGAPRVCSCCTLCGQNTLTRDFFSTLSPLCTHHIVAQGVARRVCIKHVDPHCHHMSERLLFPCFVFFLCLSCLYVLSHFYLVSVPNFNSHDVENAEH